MAEEWRAYLGLEKVGHRGLGGQKQSAMCKQVAG